MRILVVEDDAKLSAFIVNGLKQAGFAVDDAKDGEEGLHLAINGPYDAAIIDIMLPKCDGLSIIEELRRQKINTPVIILSAKRSVDDRIKGLQIGSDDYLTKPFSFPELLARVQALIRRASGVAEPSRLTAGNLSLDLLRREVTREGVKVDLQPREFALLHALALQAGQVVSVDDLLAQVWGAEYLGEPQVVYVHIRWLREKVEADPNHPQRIVTVRGVGYRLEPLPRAEG
jgi:two-component system OmpR family response regulator